MNERRNLATKTYDVQDEPSPCHDWCQNRSGIAPVYHSNSTRSRLDACSGLGYLVSTHRLFSSASDITEYGGVGPFMSHPSEFKAPMPKTAKNMK